MMKFKDILQESLDNTNRVIEYLSKQTGEFGVNFSMNDWVSKRAEQFGRNAFGALHGLYMFEGPQILSLLRTTQKPINLTEYIESELGQSALIFLFRPRMHVITISSNARIGKFENFGKNRKLTAEAIKNIRENSDVLKLEGYLYHNDIKNEMIVLNRSAIEHVETFLNPIGND